jgi:hypothetical protein
MKMHGGAAPFLTFTLYVHERSASRLLVYPPDTRLSGPHSWSGCYGVEKNLLPLPGIWTPTIQPFAILTPSMSPNNLYFFKIKWNITIFSQMSAPMKVY